MTSNTDRSRRAGRRLRSRLWIAACGLAFLIRAPLAAQDILTLDKALEFAFKNSPSIQTAAYSLKTSAENLAAQQAGLKSQFLLTLNPINISDLKTFSSLTSSYSTQDVTKTAASFSVRQPIKWTDATLTVSDNFNWQESSSSYVGGAKAGAFNNSLVLLTFDEGSTNVGGGGHIMTVAITPTMPAGYKDTCAYTHYSMLHTIEQAWGLPYLCNAASASSMSFPY